MSAHEDWTQHITTELAALLEESRKFACMRSRQQQQALHKRVAALEHTVWKRFQKEEKVIQELEQLEQQAIERQNILLKLLNQQEQQQQQDTATQSFENQQQQPSFETAQQDTQPTTMHYSDFKRITKYELEHSIPRTMRSGISVTMLNEALYEVQQLLLHNEQAWVTEQEIRQSCSFFRYGEATARAMLLLLCHLHRMVQRPEKGGDFIYQVVVVVAADAEIDT